MNSKMDGFTARGNQMFGIKVISIALIAALLWGIAGIQPAKAATDKPEFGWKQIDTRRFMDIAYGNGVYVAISEKTETVNFYQIKSYEIWTSENLQDWSKADVEDLTTRPLSSVHFHDGQFVISAQRSDGNQNGVPYEGSVMLHSSDGRDWSGLPTTIFQLSSGFTAGMHFNDRYVAGVLNGRGVWVFNEAGNPQWNQIENATPSNVRSNDAIVYNQQAYVVAGYNVTQPRAYASYSLDLNTWHSFETELVSRIDALATDGTILIGVGKDPDGPSIVTINLAAQTFAKAAISNVPANNNWQHYTFNSAAYDRVQEKFIAITNSGHVFSSGDGTNWSPDYSDLNGGTTILSTPDGDFAFGYEGIFKRISLEEPAFDGSLRERKPNGGAFTISVDESASAKAQQVGIVYSLSPDRDDDDAKQQGYINSVEGNVREYVAEVTGVAENTRFYYWPYVTDRLGFTYYGSRGEAVSTIGADKPIIVGEPADTTVTLGHAVPVLTVDAVIQDEGVLNYQWFSSEMDFNRWGTAIPGANGSSFTAPAEELGTTYYYAEVTNTLTGDGWTNAETTATRAAKVSVNPDLPDLIAPIEEEITFHDLYVEYEPEGQEVREIEITNIGTTDLNQLSVRLSGYFADSFELTQPASSLVRGAPSTSFTISAKNGLPAGTYTAELIISAANMADVTVRISQYVHNGNGPSNPRNLSATEGDKQVELNWSSAWFADHYNIYASTESRQFGQPLATVTESTYTVTGLNNGTPYYFVIEAVNEYGQSGYSNQAGATPWGTPGTPANVSATAGDKQAVITFELPDDGGSPILGYRVTASNGASIETGPTLPIVFPNLENGVSYSFSVTAINAAGPGGWSAISNEVTPLAPDVVTPPVVIHPGNPSDTGAEVLVNGKTERIGKIRTELAGGRSIATIEMDEEQLEAKLAGESTGAVITLPAQTGSDVAIGELSGKMVKTMESRGAVLELVTEEASYKLAASQIGIGDLAAAFGDGVDLQDIKVRFEISNGDSALAERLRAAASRQGMEMVAHPVEFKLTATYGGKTMEVSRFERYVERSIVIPDGIDPGKITTGVVLENDGAMRHVPTRVLARNGKYVAVINSLTNSAYAVVWHPISFEDGTGHWAKDSIDEMGSRMVVSGNPDGTFAPDRSVTRAEFATMLVNGLGLKPEEAGMRFADVGASDWHNGAIHAAADYGLLQGYEDGTFRPANSITREQAMYMMSKAMGITGIKANLPKQAADEVLDAFADKGDISAWAADSAAESVLSGIVKGRSGALLAPKAHLTRAEAAVLIRFLLQKSDLI